MSTSPIDIMQTRAIIDQDTHDAACWFGRLSRIVLGRPGCARDSLDLTLGSGAPAESPLRGPTAYAFCVECLEPSDR